MSEFYDVKMYDVSIKNETHINEIRECNNGNGFGGYVWKKSIK